VKYFEILLLLAPLLVFFLAHKDAISVRAAKSIFWTLAVVLGSIISYSWLINVGFISNFLGIYDSLIVGHHLPNTLIAITSVALYTVECDMIGRIAESKEP
jgi:hypothetical protein